MDINTAVNQHRKRENAQHDEHNGHSYIMTRPATCKAKVSKWHSSLHNETFLRNAKDNVEKKHQTQFEFKRLISFELTR